MNFDMESDETLSTTPKMYQEFQDGVLNLDGRGAPVTSTHWMGLKPFLWNC